MNQIDRRSPLSSATRTTPEATSDFVHFVLHYVAQHEGKRCSVCVGSHPLRHAHYLEGPDGLR